MVRRSPARWPDAAAGVTAVVATIDSVVRDGRGGVLLMLRNVRRCGLAGLEVAAVPAVVGALALLNWTLQRSVLPGAHGGQRVCNRADRPGRLLCVVVARARPGGVVRLGQHLDCLSDGEPCTTPVTS